MPDDIKPVGTDSKVDSITVNSNPSEKTPDTTASNTDKKANNTIPKKLIITVASILLVILVLAGSVFLKIGNQSVLARGFDAVGQHKLALASDYIVSKGMFNLTTASATLDPSKPEDCANIWTQINNKSLSDIRKDFDSTNIADYFKSSMNAKYSIQPVANAYKDKFNFEGKYSISTDTKNSAFAFKSDSKIVADTDSLQKIYPSEDFKNLDLGLVTLSGSAKAISQSDKFFLNLSQLDLKTKSFNEKASLPEFYSSQMPSSTAKPSPESTQMVTKFADKMLSNKMSDMVTDDTGKAMSTYLCSGIKSYTISAPKDVTFAYSNETKNVRAITTELKSDFAEIYLKGIPDIVDRLSKDQKLKPFLKSKYNDLKEINASGLPTQDEYNKSIDDLFKGYKKEELVSNIELAIAGVNRFVKISSPTIVSYLDMSNMQVYSNEYRIVIIPTTVTLDQVKNPELSNILSEGVDFKIAEYNIKFGSKADSIENPANSKDISQFSTDFANTSLGKKMTEIQEKLIPKPVIINSPETTPDTTTLPSTPVDPSLNPDDIMADPNMSI